MSVLIRVQAAVIGLLLSAASGCALLPTALPASAEPAVATDTASSSASAPTDGRRPQLDIAADSALVPLLRRSTDLARAVDSPEASSINPLEWARLMATAPAQARQALQTEGFFKAQAQAQMLSAPQEPLLRMRLSVQPGEPVRVSRLTLEFQGELSELADQGPGPAQRLRDNIGRNWPLQPGKPFRSDDWSEAKNSVLAQLRAAGYAAAAWSGTGAQVDVDQAQVRLFLVADSGPLFRLGRIQVEGAERHPAAEIEALADIEPGKGLTESRLLAYQERLTKTGLFDQVSVSYDPDPEQAAAATLKVLVKESPLYTTTFSAGYSSNNGPKVGASHLMRRVMDHPLRLKNTLEWARDQQSWQAELATHLDQNLHRNLLGISWVRTIDDVLRSDTLGLRVGRGLESQRQDWLLTANLEQNRVCGLTSFCVDISAAYVQAQSTWRRLDNLLLPTRGWALQMQAAAGQARSDISPNGWFGRIYGKGTYYLPVADKWYGQARLELGHTQAERRIELPDSQLFWAGGDDSIRGYAYKSVGGGKSQAIYKGGRRLVTGSLELAHPVSERLPSVWWAGFVDGGDAGDSWRAIDPVWGYGLGLRWRSPVGAFKVDWAWGQAAHKGRLHLSLGVSF